MTTTTAPVRPLVAECLYGFTEDPSVTDGLVFFAPLPVLHADTVSILATIGDPSAWPASVPHPRPGLRVIRRAFWSPTDRNVILIETNTVMLALTLPDDVANHIAATVTSLMLTGPRRRAAADVPVRGPWTDPEGAETWTATLRLTPRPAGPTIL